MAILKSKEKEDEFEGNLSDFLPKVYIFNNLSKREIKNLSGYCYLRKYRKNETVFKQGYPNVAFYILKSGLLRISLEEGEQKIDIGTIEPTEFFGEIGLFKEEERTATVKALEESELIAISKKEFKAFLENNPRTGLKVMYKLGEVLSQNIIGLNQEMIKFRK